MKLNHNYYNKYKNMINMKKIVKLNFKNIKIKLMI